LKPPEFRIEKAKVRGFQQYFKRQQYDNTIIIAAEWQKSSPFCLFPQKMSIPTSLAVVNPETSAYNGSAVAPRGVLIAAATNGYEFSLYLVACAIQTVDGFSASTPRFPT
jgi:hypothetical protein